MFSTVLSASLRGLCVEFVQVEADTSNGLPMLHMVGYLSSEVREASERVRTAIRNTGIVLPAKKIVINLSPGNLRKKGTMFDLPIAIAILASIEKVPEKNLKETLFVGELSLDGTVRHVPGILPIVLAAKERGCRICFVPKENEKEGALVNGIEVVGIENLQELCRILLGERAYYKAEKAEIVVEQPYCQYDYADIKGQKLAKRAAEIAVSGNHNMLMIGPPGVGKSLIAKCIPSILPPLTLEESMELTRIYSIIGELNQNSPLMTQRPFRSVYHAVTKAALIGGGGIPKPGEISLAHKGVLFLDEFAEFQKSVLEALREPLEEHKIKLLRERGEYVFPAEFLLVAAMNPCPCGNYPNPDTCVCTSSQIQSYLSHISQPLLDRIDICVEMQRIKYEELQKEEKEESSAQIKNRVMKTREIQAKRYKALGIQANAQLEISHMKEYCALGKEEENLMQLAFERLGLSARMYHKVLKVARTIADMEEREQIQLSHLREALSFRMMDKKYWGGIQS